MAITLTPHAPKLGETVSLDDPPPAIRLALLRIAGVESPLAKLARHPALVPFHAIGSPFVGEAIRLRVADDLKRRVMARTAGWAKEGRIDLLLEASMHLSDKDRKEFGMIVGQMQALLLPIAEAHLPDGAKSNPPARKRVTTWKDAYRFDSDWAKEESVDHPKPPPWRFEPVLKLADPKAVYGEMVVRCERLEAGWVRGPSGVFLVRDSVRFVGHPGQRGEMRNALMVCGGDVEASDLPDGVILVADGNVKLASSNFAVARSLVVATGDIRTDLGLSAFDAALIAGGTVKSYADSYIEKSNLYAGGEIDLNRLIKGPYSKIDKITPKYDFAKTGLKFFTLADVGLTVAKSDAGLWVKAVGAKSPFRHALKPDAVLLEVNGRKVVTPDECKRAMRAATVLEYAVCKVRDGAKEKTWVVYLPDSTPKK